MSEWSLDDLTTWDERVTQVASQNGLEPYPIVYEVCDYFSMIGHMAYSGLPSMYNHWSFGKEFERILQSYNAGLEGLPYELIINSNPSIAYLMRENPLYLQILIMSHCMGHSDFFKMNRLFSETRPESVLVRMKNAKKRVQSYIEDPSIGIAKVEEIVDAAHSIRWHCDWINNKRIPHAERRNELIEKVKNGEFSDDVEVDLNKIPLEPDLDLLGFICEHGKHLDEWQVDLINIVRERSQYYIPQIRTKILNEGWACFNHFKIMNELDLDQSLHIPFLKTHNQVIRPLPGRMNPYHLGFHLFNWIEKHYGIKECFFVREAMHDETAILQYLDEEFCRELNLFSFSAKKSDERSRVYSIDEVSDHDDWKEVRKALIQHVGTNNFPIVYIDDVDKSGCLVLRHQHDGRDLELTYAEEVVKSISTLWEDAVKLLTVIEDEEFEI